MDKDNHSEKTVEDSSFSGDMDFLSYIASLAFQAMIFLGVMQSPITQKEEKNIPQAKLLIDTLLILREKTKGNLNEREQKMLDSSIYELQMKYVQETQGVEKKEKGG